MLKASAFSSNVADLITAAGYLQTRYRAPEILIGHSFGGTACLKAAAQRPGVKAVATEEEQLMADPDQ